MADGSSTSILGVAVRDLGRLRFVAQTVARHGFGELLQRSPLRRRLFGSAAVPEEDPALRRDPPGVRFRKLLEALGPTWIKLGQILSSRVDLLPPDWIEALTELQDGAPVLPWPLIEQAVVEGLGRPVSDAFAAFDQTPLATASIAQTHLATTHEGEQVVVKVQRPGIGDAMRGDLDLLFLAARALEAIIDEAAIYSPSQIVVAFEKDLLRELNFTHELANLATARELLDPERPITVPSTYPALSSRTVLTMAYFPGKPLRSLTPRSPEAREAVEQVLHSGLRQVFVDGFFHADPHPGNILVDDDGQLCLIDFGMVGHLSHEQRDDIVTLVIAVILDDVPSIARILLKMGTPTARIPMAEFRAEIARVRSTSLVAARLEDVDSSRFVQDFVTAAQRFRIKLNPDYSVLVKAAATLEGVIRTLHPDVDIVGIARPYAERLVKERYTPTRLLSDAMSGVGIFGGLLRELPGHIDQVLHDVETGNLQVRSVTPELDRLPNMLHTVGSRLTMAMFSASTTVSAALLLPDDPTTVGGVPWLSVALMLLSGLGWTVLWWWHFVGAGKKIRVGPVLGFLQRAVLPND